MCQVDLISTWINRDGKMNFKLWVNLIYHEFKFTSWKKFSLFKCGSN